MKMNLQFENFCFRKQNQFYIDNPVWLEPFDKGCDFCAMNVQWKT